MELDSLISSVLSQPDLFTLPGNRAYAQDFVAAGGTVKTQPSGHLIFYGATRRRILMTDPEGHPLHECEWSQNAQGEDQFVSARLQLDWGQWVGIKPGKLVYETHLNLAARPGWEAVTKDDLRNMAARAMKVSLEQIRFFYRDEDIVIDSSGQATIRQAKDAFYILQDGRFDQATFMSCMTAMHWERIDYLPVVELFLSLLPGTGSATFELIRSLYDDQNPKHPLPLHYRGIPPYPSEGAFRLFSQFFTPSTPGGIDPLRLFLDASHSEEVTWLPTAQYPLRYFDPSYSLGVTVSQGTVIKATQANDPSGLSYFAPKPRGLSPCGRSVTVHDKGLVLQDEGRKIDLPIKDNWGVTEFSDLQSFSESVPSWRSLFSHGVPRITPVEAFSAVLLYPEDDQEIGERECQPFLFDYVDDLGEESPQLQASVQFARRILVGGCDAALNACVRLAPEKNYTVLYRWDDLAQKQAQVLWNQCARTQQWEELKTIQFLPYHQYLQPTLLQSFDLIYFWVPFERLGKSSLLEEMMTSLVSALEPGGMLIVPGVPGLEVSINHHQLTVLHAEFIQNLPTFRLHQAILPKARLFQDLMVFVLQK